MSSSHRFFTRLLRCGRALSKMTEAVIPAYLVNPLAEPHGRENHRAHIFSIGRRADEPFTLASNLG